MLCSKHYKFDPTLPEERKRLVLTITPVHWAAEWLRPVSPNFKMVGPILAGPGRPLPEHIEVIPLRLYIYVHTRLRVQGCLGRQCCLGYDMVHAASSASCVSDTSCGS